ncbi:MAG: glycosyltransferase family 4 protein [Candidatus Korobacteraceae bacterium]
MRILTFTSLFPNSVMPHYAVFLLQRISHLAQRDGNHVVVVAPLPYAPRFLRGTSRGSVALVPKVETIAGLPVYHPRYPLVPGISMPFHGLLMYSGCLSLVRALHRQHHFDCIDSHYIFPDGLAAALIGKSLGVPVTLTARGTDIHTFSDFSTIRPQIRWTLRHANGIAAVSASLARIMSELEPSLEAAAVIGNGVDAERFFPEDRLLARKTIGIEADASLIVSVAALKQVKGCDLLVRAASLLKKSTPRCKVLFVGKGPELPALRRLASQLDCADVCTFVGAIENEQLRHYYNAAAVSCLASRNEGCPNVVLESLACGTPVVGTAVGSVPEILSRPELGILVDPSPESIHQGLRQAIERQWNRDTIAAYGRSRTWDRVAERVEDFLRRSIGKESAILHGALST